MEGQQQSNDVDVQTLRSCAKELYESLRELSAAWIKIELTNGDAPDPFAKAEKLLEKYKSLSG